MESEKPAGPPRAPLSRPGHVRRPPWLEACALLSLALLAFAGYRFGVGNQAVQVPFLKRLVDPGLYRADYLFDSLPRYPTAFFRLLAAVLPSTEWVEPAYLGLHALTAFAFVAAAFALARAATGRDGAGTVLAGLLLAGHHAGLAESGLYSAAFTHTWVATPVLFAALALGLRRRWLAAGALCGALFNLHALTAAHGAVLLFAAGLAGGRGEPLRPRLAGLAALAALALPTALPLALDRQTWDAEWVRLLYVRSAHHVDPAEWWAAGESQVPRFAFLLAFAGVLAGLYPPPAGQRRRLVAMFAAGALLVAAGAAAGRLGAFPLLLRAQLARASLPLAALALVLVAHGIACAWTPPPGAGSGGRYRARRAFEAAVAAAAFVGFAIPAATPLVPWILLATAVLALAGSRLHPAAAAGAGLAFVVGVLAWRQTGYPLFAAGPAFRALLAPEAWPHGTVFWAAAAAAGATLLAGRRARSRAGAAAARLAALAAFAALAARHFPAALEAAAHADAWEEVQLAARARTPRDAVVLVPPQPGSFRVRSERAVAGEWRDGTQQFFDAAVAREWWRRMRDLAPGLRADASGRRLLDRGGDLDAVADGDLLALAAKCGAAFVVLPAQRPRPFPRVYGNDAWVLYAARHPSPAPLPPDARDPDAWRAAEAFMREVVAPNIDRNRRADAVLRVADAAGRPLAGARVAVRQLDSAFAFGTALPYFGAPAARARGFNATQVTPAELERFLEIFNFSIPGYSGKWECLEPVEGRPSFDELDRYVAWCAEHGVRMEYHFVSGYAPPWLRDRGRDETARLFVEHAERLVARYGDRVAHWQVVNEKILFRDAPPAIRRLRQLRPDLKLGIADCARFDSAETGGRREGDLLRGLAEVRWLKAQGAPVDYFGYHGHRPFGLWADPRVMYEAFDAFAAEGVRIHVTEFGTQDHGPVEGPLRRGAWTPELQAEYYRRFFAVCFSHPAVDAVNFWGIGPGEWIRGGGLLDARAQPKPSFFALRDLVRRRWRTNLDAALDAGGALRFRGFHGTYEVAVAAPGPAPARAVFTLSGGGSNEWRMAVPAQTRRTAPPQAGSRRAGR